MYVMRALEKAAEPVVRGTLAVGASTRSQTKAEIKAAEIAQRKKERDEKRAAKAALKACEKAQKKADRDAKRLANELAAKIKTARHQAGLIHNVFIRAGAIPFNAQALKFVGENRSNTTGPTEHAVYVMLNIPWDEDAKKKYKNDTPCGREIKACFNKKCGKQTIRASIGGIEAERKAHSRAIEWLTEHVKKVDPALFLRLREYIDDGLDTEWQKTLPPEVVEIYSFALIPSQGLAAYSKSIILTSMTHYLEIYPHQYDEALRFIKVSNGDVKFEVNSSFLYRLAGPLSDEEACKLYPPKVRSAA